MAKKTKMDSSKKKSLILLSDLWGHAQNTWLASYLAALSPHYQIQNLDSCQLAQVPPTAQSQDERHQHFVEKGIDLAVQELSRLIQEPSAIIAFSIGGTIAWKAGLQGSPITKLYALSATRLRHETQCPSFPTQLTYGALDDYRPKSAWMEQMPIPVKLLPAAKHDFYADPSIIPSLLQDFQNF